MTTRTKGVESSNKARDFHHDDIIIDAADYRDNPAYLGIVTTERTHKEGLVCFFASKSIDGGGWETHPEGYTSGVCKLVSPEEADRLWREYYAAALLGEVDHQS